MGTSDDRRRVHFQSPASLVERLDAVADLFDRDRTDLLVEAIREYLQGTADSETFQELVARKYYDDELSFETVERLVDGETARRLRLLKADIESEPLELVAPDDSDIYGGDATAVDTDNPDTDHPGAEDADTDHPDADNPDAEDEDTDHPGADNPDATAGDG